MRRAPRTARAGRISRGSRPGRRASRPVTTVGAAGRAGACTSTTDDPSTPLTSSSPSGIPVQRALAGDADHVIEDPWSPCAVDRIAPADTVVMVGSGLTAVDVALTLAGRGHRGPLRMVSRRGLLPRPHDLHSAPLPVLPVPDLTHPLTARFALEWLRAAIVAGDGDWRAVFDAVRPHTNQIWAQLSETERARLVRHAGRYWEVHRHRVAPEVAARAAELIATGRLELRTGARRAHRTPIACCQSGRRARRGCERGAVDDRRRLGRQLHRPELRPAAVGMRARPLRARTRHRAAGFARTRLRRRAGRVAGRRFRPGVVVDVGRRAPAARFGVGDHCHPGAARAGRAGRDPNLGRPADAPAHPSHVSHSSYAHARIAARHATARGIAARID